MANFLHWTWLGTQQFGSAKASQIVLAENQDGKLRSAGLELLYIGADKKVYDVRETTSGDPSSWTDEVPIPSDKANQVAKATQIAVGKNADGRLELIYIGTDSKLFRIAQPQAGQFDWSPSSSKFDGQEAKQVAVVLDPIGRLAIFYVGIDDRIFFDLQKMPGVDQWQGAAPLGKDSNGNYLTAKKVAVARNANNSNLLELFYVGHNDGLYHATQQSTDIGDWDTGDKRMTRDTVSDITIAANEDGRLEIFYIDTTGRLFHDWYTTTEKQSTWSGPARFPGAKARQVSVARNDDGRLEMMYTGTDNNLYHNWQVAPNSTWVGETPFPGDTGKEIVALMNSRGSLESWYIGTNQHLYHSFQTLPNAAWTDTNGQGINVAAPPGSGLQSASNYVLQDCSILTDVAITIHITEDLYADKVAPEPTGTEPPTLSTGHGFSWQMNCFSAAGHNNIFQQYVIGFSAQGKSLYAHVEELSALGSPTKNQKDIKKTEAHLSSADGKLPAGYELIIRLRNDDNGNITEAFFLVVDEVGDAVGQATINLPAKGVKQSDLAPIVGVELNLVGEYDSQFSGFRTGAGWIQYVSSSLMKVENFADTCAATPDAQTGETSNSVYSEMSSEATNLATQTFSLAMPEVALKWPRPKKTLVLRKPNNEEVRSRS